jgi:hypothetical protein
VLLEKGLPGAVLGVPGLLLLLLTLTTAMLSLVCAKPPICSRSMRFCRQAGMGAGCSMSGDALMLMPVLLLAAAQDCGRGAAAAAESSLGSGLAAHLCGQHALLLELLAASSRQRRHGWGLCCWHVPPAQHPMPAAHGLLCVRRPISSQDVAGIVQAVCKHLDLCSSSIKMPECSGMDNTMSCA